MHVIWKLSRTTMLYNNSHNFYKVFSCHMTTLDLIFPRLGCASWRPFKIHKVCDHKSLMERCPNPSYELKMTWDLCTRRTLTELYVFSLIIRRNVYKAGHKPGSRSRGHDGRHINFRRWDHQCVHRRLPHLWRACGLRWFRVRHAGQSRHVQEVVPEWLPC